MKKPEQSPLKTPEDMLALAEALAARCTPLPADGGRGRFGRWLLHLDWRHGACALGGAGITGLLWWLTG